MIEKINEKLVLENQRLSNDNMNLRQAYSELLNQYLQLMQNKCPANILLAGQIELENKVK
jgi:uncharacterized protein YaaN involved in tellurite resistance